MSKSTAHLADVLLEEYYFHRLPEHEAEMAEDHLFWCDHCRHKLEQIQEFTMLLKQAEVSGRNSPNSKSGRIWTIWPTAASLAIAASILLLVSTHAPIPVRAPLAEITLSVARGGESANLAQSGAPFAVVIPLTQLGNATRYKVEVVDAAGSAVFETEAIPRQGRIRTELPTPLRPGQYWVRLYSHPDLELEQEYSLTVGSAGASGS